MATDQADLLNFPETSSDELSLFLSENGITHEVVGKVNVFKGVAQLGRCDAHHLIWSKAINQDVLNSPARVILLPKVNSGEKPDVGDKTFIFVENPRDTFRTILAKMFSTQYDTVRGFFDENMFTEVSPTVWIGKSSSVASDVKMGKNVVIHPGAIVYPNVTLGSNVEISAGCVIGAPGFGHVRQADGTLEHFPHIGGVSIGDNVTIGSNTCIDSGGLSPTVIGSGTKIGNLTQIAHNVEIEKDCLIGTRCQVAGGTKIGTQTEVWAGVTISNNRRIGKACNIKIGSIVISHLDDGAVVSGNFAIPHDKNLSNYRKMRDPA